MPTLSNPPPLSAVWKSQAASEVSAETPPQKQWRGLKKDRVKAYLCGIATKSKNVWTWIDQEKIARQLGVSKKTVWRVIKALADQENSTTQDADICLRLCQRQTEKNYHFEWMIAHRSKLMFDQEPLFRRRDGKTRHLRLRCRKKNLLGTRTDYTSIVNQQKRESTPPSADWKHQTPPLRPLFWLLGIPTYEKRDSFGVVACSDNQIWTHSPWKRENDKTPSCLIYVNENRFYDYSTGRGGNAVTLARIFHKDPNMPFQSAFKWLKSLSSCVTAPAAWWTPDPMKQQPCPHVSMLPRKNGVLFGMGILEPGGEDTFEKTPRNERRFRLAWCIVREQLAGISIPYLNRAGVVALVVKALERQYEKAAIEEAIRVSVASYEEEAPRFAAQSKSFQQTYHRPQWRHRDLKHATEPEDYERLFGLAYFLKTLRRNLDNAYEPPKVSAPVERNADSAAIEMCLTQIKAMFFPQEYVWITNGLRHRGWCRTAEYWLEDIKNNGVPTGAEGAWIKQNPMSKFGTGNGEVRSFRHALCEADSIGLAEQAQLAETLPYPIVSAVHSGGKSIHYLLRVDATQEAYTDLVKRLHEQFPVFDAACKDAARWTRLAGARRAGVLQAALPTPASGHRSPGLEP